jgi:hypothetical protein
MQVIQLALLLGPLVFAAVILYLHLGPFAGGGGTETGDPGLLHSMLLVTASVTLGALAGAAAVPALMLKPERLAARLGSEVRLPDGRVITDPVERTVIVYQNVQILRLALIEGSALFGLVVLSLAVVGRHLDETPVAWLAVLPLAIHLLFGMLTFPTRSAVVRFVEERILQPLRSAPRTG